LFIKELEIDNFKSFGRKTTIPFFEGFTVVSGPNGSGKSNIIDAILFVLALSSSRNLRAEKLTDLINLNSNRNTAEVALTFSDGTTIRRKIKRTAAGYYSYNYMNNRLCKQSEVSAYLADHGIIPHGYNVVMQGDITRIMEMSDGERRRILDEIAGVAEFDQKRDQALAELEVVRERIEREELLLQEASLRLVELEKERQQALLYQELQEKLVHFQGCRAAAQLNEKERELGGLTSLLEEYRISQDRTVQDRSLEVNELAYLRADQKEVEAEINRKSGAEYLKLISQLEETKGNIRSTEQTIARLKREKESNLELVNRVFMDIKRAEAKVTADTEGIRALTIDRTTLAMEQAMIRARIEKVEGSLGHQQAETGEARERLFGLISSLEEKKGERSTLLHQKDMLIEKSRMRTKEQDRLSQRLTEVRDERTGKGGQQQEWTEASRVIGEEKRAIERRLSDSERGLLSRRSSLDGVRKELKVREQELMRYEAQQQVQGDAGGRALEAVLGMDGVYGTIARLGKVPPEYMTALNVAAGGRLHNVVVEDDRVAAGAIRYLKEEKAGRLTFLPLTKLKPIPLPPVGGDGIIGYARHLIAYDPLYDPAFGQVFGTTLVVDTLNRARTLMGKHRMVTLEGELVEKSGAMTGGFLKKTIKGFSASVDDDIRRLQAVIATLGEEASDLENGISRLTAESELLRNQRSEADQRLARYRIMLEEYGHRTESLAGEQKTLEETLAQMASDMEAGVAEITEVESSLDSIGDQIVTINDEITGLKKRLEGTEIPELTEQLEKQRKELEETERRLRNKESDLADLQRERAYFIKRVEELNRDREQAISRNLEIDGEAEGAGEQIARYREEIARLEEEQKSFSGELEVLQEKRSGIATQIQESEHRLIEFDTGIERVKLQITATQERMAVVSSEIAVIREQASGVETTLTLDEIEEGIATTDRAIRKLGAVNMLAVEEYARVEERVTERREKKEILSVERSSLMERIEGFEKMKFDAFMAAYTAINENFRAIFARLTSGTGRLILDNDEDPFAGGLTFAVQPRDKVVHLLNALSGGEKSLTTLAFIFSIQQYIPAPFYALDEVDMSLDGSNVERIAAMLKEISNTSQFIIVSLRKPMIEQADRILGVTVRPDKSTLVTGVKMNV
jgi:chromosome segregation protein